MTKHNLKAILFGVMVFALMALNTQGNFVQCPGGVCDVAEGISANSDMITGTQGMDIINANAGNDVVFGAAGPDFIGGNDDNDVLLGGRGSDVIQGDNGHDNIWPGPDTVQFRQIAEGNRGNDMVNVLAGETVGCLVIEGGPGVDWVNLIGFGPYTVQQPFQPGFGNGWLLLFDPIAGGRIFIRIFENTDGGAEAVNGLTSPNLAILTPAEFDALVVTKTGTDPCPTHAFSNP